MRREQPTTAQLYEALSERADLWQQQDDAQTDPASSSKQPATGTAAAAAADAALPGSSLLSPSRTRHQLLLLQHALFPLTRSCQQGDAALRDDDLRPHAPPKAKQLYDTLVTGVRQCPWYMLNPEGTPRLLWDLLLFVFTTGLVVYVPLLIAFYASMAQCAYFEDAAVDPAPEPNVPGPTRAGITFMTLTNAAFLLDILVNFVTGVVRFNADTGLLETSYDLLDVALTYARTWLVIDIVSCLPLECMLTAGGVAFNYNLGHLNRLLKATAVLRRAHGDPFRIINQIPSIRRNFNYSLRLVVVSFSVLLLALHYFACCLWLVLRVQSFPAQTWPVQLGIVTGENVYQQWTWAIFAVTSAMIGLGYGSYPPVTFPEAVLWIVEMICMAGGFAVVNGFIFSAVLEGLADNARYKTQLLRATKEVEHRRLTPALSSRVISYYKLKYSRHSAHMPIASIMDELEPGLRIQVALASVGQLLRTMPVLNDCPQLLQRVAMLMEPQVAAKGQLVAIPGSPASHLYFLTRGFADVYMNDLLIDTLVPGDSFCEAALLPVPAPLQLPSRLRSLWSGGRSFSSTCWPTLFAVKALSNCNLMVLSRDKFRDLLQEYQWAQDAFLDLGVDYAQTLSELPMLEELWHRAAAFDPLDDRLALMDDPVGSRTRLQQAAQGAGRLGRAGWWRHQRLSQQQPQLQQENVPV